MMKNYNSMGCRLQSWLKLTKPKATVENESQVFSSPKGSYFLGVALFALLAVGNISFGQTIIINPATDGSFEGADFAAGGWTALNNANGGGSWVQSTAATAGFTGTKSAYISNDETASPPPHAYNITGVRTSALYKDVTIPAGESSISLSFKWVGIGESGYDRLQVWAVPTDYTPLNANASMTTTGVAPTGRVQLGTGVAGYHSSATWTTANIIVPAAYAGTSFRLVFQWRNDASGGSNPPIAIDDVSLTSLCTGVIATAPSAITTTSAMASWNALPGATSYDVRYRTVGAASWTTIAGVNGTSVSLPSLVAYTNYEYQVMANGSVCNSFSQSITFLTGYCVPTGGTSYYLTNVTTTGGITNISNPTGSNGGYADFSATNSVSAIIGQSVTLNLSTNTSTHYFYGWIDWNNDLDFNDANESIFATSSYTSGYSGTITIPAGTPAGNYRMRVANTYAGAITSCGPAVNGEYEDYTFTVLEQTSCSGTPVAATVVSSLNSVCVSGSVTLTATLPSSADSGLTYQWYNSAGIIPAAVALTYTTPVLTSAESYYYKTTCTNSGLSVDSNTIVVAVNQPTVVSTTAATRCGVGSVNLDATVNTGADAVWYAAETGGTSLFTGATFETPSISSTTTYYVAASEGGSQESAGKLASVGGGEYVTTGVGIVFNVTAPVTLASTLIYPIGSGTVTIGLYNSAGVEIMATPAVSVTGSGISTPVTVPLNFVVPVGSGYRLLMKGYTGISNLIRDSSGNSFPYNSTNVSVTAGYISGTSTSYYFFYNLQVVTGCTSARTAVVATVTAPPTLTLSSASSSICAAASSNAVTITAGATDYDTFVWSPSTGVSGNSTTGWTFNPTATTTYTLTATQTTGTLCAATATYELVVNPLPTAITIQPSATTACATDIQTLTAAGGTISISGKIGSGTASNTLSTPFKNNWGGSKSQALYTAAELTALGMEAGQKITSIGYVTLTGTGIVFNQFTINAGFVSPSTIGTTFIGGATTSVVSSTYTHTAAGNADFVLSTPLLWDGVSNLLVETCFNNNNSGTGSSVAVESSTVATGLNLYLSQDNNSTVCSSASSPSGTTVRPNLRVSAVLNADITWSPMTNLYTDAAATTPYTGTTATTVYAKFEAAGSYIYTVNATIAETGCSTTASTTITATATTQPTASAQTFCGGATVADLVATGTAIQWYSAQTGGMALADTTVLTSGTYYTSQTLNACESARVAVEVTVNTTAEPVVAEQTFCNAATVADLIATGTAIQWYAEEVGGVALADTEALTTATYFVSQTENSCESARTSVLVTVNTTDAPEASAQTICGAGTIADLVATGTDIQWYSTLTGGTALVNTTALVAGTYYASQTENACESPRTSVEVTINALPTATIARVDDTLTASIENATYQWILCDDSSTPIEGATSQSYTATAAGSYAVMVTENGCTATSECFDITTLSNTTFEMAKLGYYPNPVTDVLTVSCSNTISGIQVFDITGRLVRNMKVNANEVKVDMANMPASVYIVKVLTDSSSAEFKVIKK